MRRGVLDAEDLRILEEAAGQRPLRRWVGYWATWPAAHRCHSRRIVALAAAGLLWLQQDRAWTTRAGRAALERRAA